MSSLALSAPRAILDLAWRRRRALVAAIRHDFAARYHGSLLGLAWIFIFPLLFLLLYVFVYLVVFRVSLPNGGPMDYALFVISGMTPYLATMEAGNQSAGAIRASMGLVRSAMLEIEMLPLRVTFVALVSEIVGFVLVAILSIWTGRMSANFLLFPVVLFLHTLFLAGLACFISVLGALVRDVGYVISLVFMLLMFLSPIAFMPDMMPAQFQFLVVWNPIHYMIDSFRMVFFDRTAPDFVTIGIFAGISIAAFVGGTAALQRLKRVVPDYV